MHLAGILYFILAKIYVPINCILNAYFSLPPPTQIILGNSIIIFCKYSRKCTKVYACIRQLPSITLIAGMYV